MFEWLCSISIIGSVSNNSQYGAFYQSVWVIWYSNTDHINRHNYNNHNKYYDGKTWNVGYKIFSSHFQNLQNTSDVWLYMAHIHTNPPSQSVILKMCSLPMVCTGTCHIFMSISGTLQSNLKYTLILIHTDNTEEHHCDLVQYLWINHWLFY